MDSSATIRKTADDFRVPPNLLDYSAERRQFSWTAARNALSARPGEWINIAHEAVDRHVAAGRGERQAFRFISRGSLDRIVTYGELSLLTNRFANVLRSLGIGKSDRLFILWPHPRTLYRRIGQSEERHGGVATVLGLWPGADRDARESRCGQDPGDNRRAL